MIKFILVLQLCYSGGQCFTPMTKTDFVFDNYKSCAIAGYEESLMIISEIKDIETNKPIIRFWCEEHKDEKKTNI